VRTPVPQVAPRWILRSPDLSRVQTLLSCPDLLLTPLLARLLVNRGIDTPERAISFLSPSLREGLRSPLLFPDMGKATERILRARTQDERVCVYGDYDVDGITGSAQLLLFLRELGMGPDLYIPHRLREGYGLNLQAVQALADRGVKVLITVDCGATGHREIALAQRLGMDVIVCDHHHVPQERPPAYAVLNPMEKDCPFAFSGLSGAGVVFYLLMGLRMRLREQGQAPLPDLRRYLDLATLGTVADLVPLVEENRVLVTYGLKEIARCARPGMRALKAVSGEGAISTSYIGFRLGPRLNAGGRLAEAQKAVELLTTADEKRAQALAVDLDQENRVRQRLEEHILTQAITMVEAWPDLASRRSIVLASPEWHPGVIGIVASRLVERFHRPTILIALEGDTGKGSGRSPKQFHLYEGLKLCADLFDGYGGHRQAAGLAIRTTRVRMFADRFEQIARERLSIDDLVPTIEVDAVLDLSMLDTQTIDDVRKLEPHGQGNPEPVFLARDVVVRAVRVVGQRSSLEKPGHLKLAVQSTRGGQSFEAIGFGMASLPIQQGARLEVLYTPTINVWNGSESVQLRLRDLKLQ
jgi:single-stranded-DNA-specific exonuclease